jgi:hypothetical protein
MALRKSGSCLCIKNESHLLSPRPDSNLIIYLLKIYTRCGRNNQALDLLSPYFTYQLFLRQHSYSSADTEAQECPGSHCTYSASVVYSFLFFPKSPSLTIHLVRFIGGILYIVYTYNSTQIGWIIVAIILEGAGVIPLLLVLVGLVRLIHALDFPKNEKLRKSIVYLRLIFLVGIALLIAGSSLIGNYNNASSLRLGLALAKAGYMIFIFVLVVLVAGAVVLWMKRKILCTDSEKVSCSTTIIQLESNHFQDPHRPLLFISFLDRSNGICLSIRLRLKFQVEYSRGRRHCSIGLHAFPHGVHRCFDLRYMWSLASTNKKPE